MAATVTWRPQSLPTPDHWTGSRMWLFNVGSKGDCSSKVTSKDFDISAWKSPWCNKDESCCSQLLLVEWIGPRHWTPCKDMFYLPNTSSYSTSCTTTPMGMARGSLEKDSHWLCWPLLRKNVSYHCGCLLKVAWGHLYVCYHITSHNWGTNNSVLTLWPPMYACIGQWTSVYVRGVCFVSEEEWHQTHLQCTIPNGLAERFVRTFKRVMQTGEKSGSSLSHQLSEFLFSYQLTLHTTTGISPGELFLQRKLRTKFDLLKPDQRSVVTSRQHLQKGAVDKLRVHVPRDFLIRAEVMVRTATTDREISGFLVWLCRS